MPPLHIRGNRTSWKSLDFYSKIDYYSNMDKDEALIKVWNRLNGLWYHHQDGSDFFPIEKGFLDKGFSRQVDRIKQRGEISILFDIVFNEIQHVISDAVSPERRKELR